MLRGHCLDSAVSSDVCTTGTCVLWCCTGLCFRMPYTGRAVEVKAAQLNLASA